ncbi:hypothetical protein CLI98_02393 [Bacillus velezensis]|nr:hypothetical protein NG74_00502 [Bacillus velezensis]ASK60535.1 hypothetical protein CFN60_02585 [Bacillus velezensis]ATD75643.1 hypothetical protein CLI98_02393 [Bacillus velezensis]ATV24905.1 hypothetical protein CS547_02590 [Bacillus sp. Lzh-5]MVZ94394.1 hypothetical protein [Bacillus velezensis]
MSVTFILLLTACGGSKYHNAINEVMKQEKKVRKEIRADSDEHKRDNAIILVYDGDRLGLYKKTPDYKEVKSKETKTMCLFIPDRGTIVSPLSCCVRASMLKCYVDLIIKFRF